MDRLARRGRGAHTTPTSPASPAPVTSAGAVGIPFPFLVNGDLINRDQIRTVVRLYQAFNGELSIDRLHDLFVQYLIRILCVFDPDSFICFVFGKIGSRHKVVTDLLRRRGAAETECGGKKKGNSHFRPIPIHINSFFQAATLRTPPCYPLNRLSNVKFPKELTD